MAGSRTASAGADLLALSRRRSKSKFGRVCRSRTMTSPSRMAARPLRAVEHASVSSGNDVEKLLALRLNNWVVVPAVRDRTRAVPFRLERKIITGG